MRAAPLLSLRAITKSFPGVLANDRVDLDIYPGEVHALIGENGAGKSTLMKILYGFYRADSGEILHEGVPVRIESPQDARRLGIGLVFQELVQIRPLSVAENIALFLPDPPRC
jgi:simple sugar transport system ATP-binding protein